jgi:NAD(P)-dependent dehydrogenase (short-subunit alcohol dehydrogenase family)
VTTSGGVSAPRPHAVVVGATGAVGASVAELLHARGYALTLTHRSGEPAHAVVAGTWHKLDVRDTAGVTSVMAEAEKEYGTPHALVYAAGIMRDRPLLTMNPDDWCDVVETNLTGAFTCIRAVARSMLVAGCGASCSSARCPGGAQRRGRPRTRRRRPGSRPSAGSPPSSSADPA